MTLENLLDVVEMHDPQTLTILWGTKKIIITGDAELQELTQNQLSHKVVKVSPLGNGIAIRID